MLSKWGTYVLVHTSSTWSLAGGGRRKHNSNGDRAYVTPIGSGLCSLLPRPSRLDVRRLQAVRDRVTEGVAPILIAVGRVEQVILPVAAPDEWRLNNRALPWLRAVAQIML